MFAGFPLAHWLGLEGENREQQICLHVCYDFVCVYELLTTQSQ